VLRNNKAVAAVVGMDALERLARLEELEGDLRLLSVALARTVTDSGRRYSLEFEVHVFTSGPPGGN
jgi:hypothetical protein